ncbi:MAG: hypothetical protein MUO88_17810, partial [Desulfobacterales bacterium]|nr:hypothetical protein [Desulfobacterales bacterium]
MLSSIKLIFVCLVLILVLTIFIPPTAFCDTKSETIGTTGVLSIGPNGNIYIQFTESHTKSTAGNFIMGIPEELTQTQSDQHDFMQAAYNAYNAWLKCEEAKKKAADGKITKVQMEFECTRYNLYNSKEVSIWATAILDNNMGKDIPLAATMSEISKLEIEKDNQILSDLTDLGAEPTVLGYEPPGEAEG